MNRPGLYWGIPLAAALVYLGWGGCATTRLPSAAHDDSLRTGAQTADAAGAAARADERADTNLAIIESNFDRGPDGSETSTTAGNDRDAGTDSGGSSDVGALRSADAAPDAGSRRDALAPDSNTARFDR